MKVDTAPASSPTPAPVIEVPVVEPISAVVKPRLRKPLVKAEKEAFFEDSRYHLESDRSKYWKVRGTSTLILTFGRRFVLLE